MKKGRSPIVYIAICLGFGVLVSVFIYSYMKPTTVVEAKESISAGTILSADLVDIKTVPGSGLPSDIFKNINDVVGKTIAVSRAPGDYITSDVLTDSTSAGVPSQLEAGHVAISIDVNRASAVGGILREGQTVTIIGLLTPDVLSTTSSAISASEVNGQTAISETPEAVVSSVITYSGTPTPEPTQVLGPIGRIAITGIRILMVPQDFQYQEIASGTDQQTMFANEQATNKDTSIIVLDVPNTKVEIAPGYFVNPATLIAALDKYGSIYLALESSSISTPNASSGAELTINLADLYNTINKNTEPTPTK
jgi:Flp pilus assembly protein CpaB